MVGWVGYLAGIRCDVAIKNEGEVRECVGGYIQSIDAMGDAKLCRVRVRGRCARRSAARIAGSTSFVSWLVVWRGLCWQELAGSCPFGVHIVVELLEASSRSAVVEIVPR
jgi:hypothetical protein